MRMFGRENSTTQLSTVRSNDDAAQADRTARAKALRQQQIEAAAAEAAEAARVASEQMARMRAEGDAAAEANKLHVAALVTNYRNMLATVAAKAAKALADFDTLPDHAKVAKATARSRSFG